MAGGRRTGTCGTLRSGAALPDCDPVGRL